MRFGAVFGVPKKSGVARLFPILATAVLANFQEVAHPSRLIPDNLQNAPKFTSFSHFIGHLPENCEKNAR